VRVSYGIDFGTTNSAGVMLQEDQVYELGDSTGRPLPSIVAIDKATGRMSAGREVWDTREERAKSGREFVVQSVKRYLGKDYRWHTNAGVFTPEDVAAKIFEQVGEQVRLRKAPAMTRAAVTIPVGFPANARAALRRAARSAGIDVSTFIHEPTAALVRYLRKVRNHQYVAVFDWGGGTLDISVLKLRDNRVFELATRGVAQAGDDIDSALARAVHTREFKKRDDARSFDNLATRDQDQLRTRCEVAKCEMSARDETEILVQSYGGEDPLDFRVTRQFFDGLVGPFVDRAIELLAEAVMAANISFEGLDGLLVIGGTSNLQLLREKLFNDDRFNSALESSEAPEWDVALGAAVVDRMPSGYEIVESVGLVLCDETFHPLVHPGEKAYTEEKTIAVSLVEDVPQANIVLAKADSPTGSGPRKRAFQFQVPTAGFDGERIELAYAISEDLTFRVKARSETRGQSYEVSHEYEDLRFAYHIDE